MQPIPPRQGFQPLPRPPSPGTGFHPQQPQQPGPGYSSQGQVGYNAQMAPRGVTSSQQPQNQYLGTALGPNQQQKIPLLMPMTPGQQQTARPPAMNGSPAQVPPPRPPAGAMQPPFGGAPARGPAGQQQQAQPPYGRSPFGMPNAQQPASGANQMPGTPQQVQFGAAGVFPPRQPAGMAQPRPQGQMQPQQPGMMPMQGNFPGMQAPGAVSMHGQQSHAGGYVATAPMLATRGGNIVIDPANQCPKEFCRLTFDKFPESENVRQRAGNIPLAAIFRPFCDLEGTPNVPVVNFAPNPVIRCRRCRSYVSPFSFFIENGRRWQCALCWNVNDVEPDYFCPLNLETGKRQDQAIRPELNSGIIDILAPEEYTLRPPQPPAFLFVIDVSRDAVASGLLQAVALGIKRSLSRLPGQPRTQVGFITFDSEVHFYDLSGGPEGTGGPRMLVVSDLAMLFHPTSTDELLVDLIERRQTIDVLLDQLASMHAGLSSDSALGPAIEAAYDIMAPLGGKMTVFQAQLPMMVDPPADEDKEKHKMFMSFGGLPKPGRGADGRALGGPNEHDFLKPASQWYAIRADHFIRQHITLDWYCCTSVYCDLATCAELCHLTAGRLRYYPRFHAHKDGERLMQDIYRSLTSPCATEAVMRVRASSGAKVTRFYGSFSMRARDLIALPQDDSDGVHGFEFGFEEDMLPGKFIALQSAVLYTTTNGERRIRVTNLAVPLSNNPLEVLQGMQPDVVSAFLFKRAADEARGESGGLDQARNQLKVAFWRMLETPGFAQSSPQMIDLMARYTVGAIKSPALRGGTDIGFDERYYLLRLIGRAPLERLDVIMRPRLWALNPAANGVPKEVPLTRQSLSSDSLFMMDNGLQLMLWIGSAVQPAIFQQLFGSMDAANTDPSLLRLVPPSPQGGDSPLKMAVWSLVQQVRKSRLEDFTPVVIVREGDASIEARFYWGLVNDPATFRGGEISAEELISRGSKVAGYAGRPATGNLAAQGPISNAPGNPAQMMPQTPMPQGAVPRGMNPPRPMTGQGPMSPAPNAPMGGGAMPGGQGQMTPQRQPSSMPSQQGMPGQRPPSPGPMGGMPPRPAGPPGPMGAANPPRMLPQGAMTNGTSVQPPSQQQPSREGQAPAHGAPPSTMMVGRPGAPPSPSLSASMAPPNPGMIPPSQGMPPRPPSPTNLGARPPQAGVAPQARPPGTPVGPSAPPQGPPSQQPAPRPMMVQPQQGAPRPPRPQGPGTPQMGMPSPQQQPMGGMLPQGMGQLARGPPPPRGQQMMPPQARG